MSEIWKVLEGKRTHILVILAMILNLFGAAETPMGMDLDNIDFSTLAQTVLIGSISTFKMAFDRYMKK